MDTRRRKPTQLRRPNPLPLQLPSGPAAGVRPRPVLEHGHRPKSSVWHTHHTASSVLHTVAFAGRAQKEGRQVLPLWSRDQFPLKKACLRGVSRRVYDTGDWRIGSTYR